MHCCKALCIQPGEPLAYIHPITGSLEITLHWLHMWESGGCLVYYRVPELRSLEEKGGENRRTSGDGRVGALALEACGRAGASPRRLRGGEPFRLKLPPVAPSTDRFCRCNVRILRQIAVHVPVKLTASNPLQGPPFQQRHQASE